MKMKSNGAAVSATSSARVFDGGADTKIEHGPQILHPRIFCCCDLGVSWFKFQSDDGPSLANSAGHPDGAVSAQRAYLENALSIRLRGPTVPGICLGEA